jgi:hypothetical protein
MEQQNAEAQQIDVRDPSETTRVSRDDLVETAVFLQRALNQLEESVSLTSFPLERGGLRFFPRPAPEARAAQYGFVVLRESLEQAIAALYAVIALAEREKGEVHVALLVPIEPYIAAYRSTLQRDASAQAGEVEPQGDSLE